MGDIKHGLNMSARYVCAGISAHTHIPRLAAD